MSQGAFGAPTWRVATTQHVVAWGLVAFATLLGNQIGASSISEHARNAASRARGTVAFATPALVGGAIALALAMIALLALRRTLEGGATWIARVGRKPVRIDVAEVTAVTRSRASGTRRSYTGMSFTIATSDGRTIAVPSGAMDRQFAPLYWIFQGAVTAAAERAVAGLTPETPIVGDGWVLHRDRIQVGAAVPVALVEIERLELDVSKTRIIAISPVGSTLFELPDDPVLARIFQELGKLVHSGLAGPEVAPLPPRAGDPRTNSED